MMIASTTTSAAAVAQRLLLRQRPPFSHHRYSIPSPTATDTTTVTSRGFAKQARKSKKAEKAVALTYFERKEAAKQARTTQYQKQQDKKVADKTRRSHAPRHVLKQNFRDWWNAQQARDEILDRKARQANQEWQIQVALVVERLPQILPDIEEWERDYDELAATLKQYGKDYPPELVPPMPSPAPITDEELLAMLPDGFVPAPRITPADESGDTSTHQRKLQERIYCVVNGRIPTTVVQSDNEESLLAAAQRTWTELHKGSGKGPTMDIYCPSHAPMGVQLRTKEEIDKDDTSSSTLDDTFFGTKTFFVKVQLDADDGDEDGNQKPQRSNKEGEPKVEWLDRTEIVDHMRTTVSENESLFYKYLL